MKIETRFNIGDEIYTVKREDVTDTCPNCKGVGHFFLKDGTPVTDELGGKCYKCDGKGERRVGDVWVTEGPFEIGGILLRPLSSLEQVEDIESYVHYMNKIMSGPSAGGDLAFANKVAAYNWCHEENKKPLKGPKQHAPEMEDT